MLGICTIFGNVYFLLITFYSFSVGPLYVDTTIPQMEDIEKKFSSDFNGWVNKGGHWKPTECKARKKVKCPEAHSVPFS